MMRILLLSSACLLLLPSVGQAQAGQAPTAEAASSDELPDIATLRLRGVMADEPAPALRYRFAARRYAFDSISDQLVISTVLKQLVAPLLLSGILVAAMSERGPAVGFALAAAGPLFGGSGALLHRGAMGRFSSRLAPDDPLRAEVVRVRRGQLLMSIGFFLMSAGMTAAFLAAPGYPDSFAIFGAIAGMVVGVGGVGLAIAGAEISGSHSKRINRAIRQAEGAAP